MSQITLRVHCLIYPGICDGAVGSNRTGRRGDAACDEQMVGLSHFFGWQFIFTGGNGGNGPTKSERLSRRKKALGDINSPVKRS